MSKTSEAIARARRTASEAKENAVEMAAEVGTSYLLGSMEASGQIRNIPQVFGMPRTVTLALAAKLVAYNTSGRVSQVARGVASSATAVAVYQFARGQTVSGVGDDVGRMSARGRILENASARAIGHGRASADPELAELERSSSPLHA
jgi:hypothetical protein